MSGYTKVKMLKLFLKTTKTYFLVRYKMSLRYAFIPDSPLTPDTLRGSSLCPLGGSFIVNSINITASTPSAGVIYSLSVNE